MQHKELTNEDLMDLEAQRKDEDRQEEEVTEELKRFIIQEMAKGFFFEEALLVFETQGQNVPGYTQVAATLQKAVQCCCVIYDEKNKGATAQTSLDHFFSKG